MIARFVKVGKGEKFGWSFDGRISTKYETYWPGDYFFPSLGYGFFYSCQDFLREFPDDILSFRKESFNQEMRIGYKRPGYYQPVIHLRIGGD